MIRIKNLGPIRDFTLDLEKNFNLFVGNNNIGKSYAITLVYLIIKNIIESIPGRSSSLNRLAMHNPFINYDDIFDESDIFKNKKSLDELISRLKPRENKDITAIVEVDIKSAFEKTILPPIQNSLINTFSSLDNLQNRFSTEPPEIILSTDDTTITITISQGKLAIQNIKTSREFELKKIKQTRNPHDSDNKTTIYCYENEEKKDYFYSAYVNIVLFRSVFSFCFDFARDIQSVHYLPASRSGLYQALSAFGQIIAELSKNRSFLSKKIELPGISEPVSDYFIRLSDIRVTKKNFEDKVVNEIAKAIEEDILKGKVEFNPQTKQLMFFPKNTDLKLELSSTSSMVSELAPIVSYLRYVITQNNRNQRSKNRKFKHLIMIEEPEAHLHPEIQIKLTEIFSKLVKADVKLIITSHSNYIFNKVNNLILSKEISVDDVHACVFKQTASGSIAQSLPADLLGIEDDNFSDPTNDLFDEKMALIDLINHVE